jgi:hypothetical protein
MEYEVIIMENENIIMENESIIINNKEISKQNLGRLIDYAISRPDFQFKNKMSKLLGI